MTDTTTTTTAELEPAPGRVAAIVTKASGPALHLIDTWSHAPAGVARALSDLWGWAGYRKAYAAELEGLTKPSDRIKAHTRLTERLGTTNLFWRKSAVVVAVLVAFVTAVRLLPSVGALWWPLLLAVAYGAGRYALRPRQAAHDGTDDAEAYTGERAGIRKMLFAKLTKVDRPESITVSELEEVYDGEAGSIGRRFKIGLPSTNTVEDVKRLQANLAGELGTKTVRVNITEGTTPRQALVFVADQSPDEIGPPTWPLADATKAHRFIADPFPLGIDTATRKPVHVDLSGDAGILITGLPGSGKTWTLRAFLAAGAGDPATAVILGDFKGELDDHKGPLDGTLDWAVFGNTPDNLEAFAAVLVKVQKLMDRRIAHNLPKDPIIVAVDECQVALKSPAIVDLLEDLIKRGRSAGVRAFLSTQEPTQKSIPTKIRNVIGVHIGFRQNEQSSSLIALGAGSLDEGMDCTKLPGGPAGQGICFYAEAGVKVKAAKVDNATATAVASRAGGPTHAALFTEPEFPTYPDPARGPALHVVADPEPETILDHLDAVWPTTPNGTPAPNAWLDHLLTLLQADPTTGTYDGWGRPELRKAARDHGLEPREKVRVGERSFPGFTYSDVLAAQAAWNARGRGSEATRTTRTP